MKFFRLLLASSAICLSSSVWADQSVTFDVSGASGDFLGKREAQHSSSNPHGTVAYDWHGDQIGFGIHAGVGTDSNVLRFDGSYVAIKTGAWTYGLEAVQRNWSPSRHSSLILSKNARPFYAAHFGKNEFSASDRPWLSWIGPWKAEVFLGQSEGEVNPKHTKLFGMRLQMQPLDGFEIDLVRTAQWGGEGRSEDLHTLFDIIIGQTNEGKTSEVNQIAGIGFSYTLPKNSAPVRLYLQAVGEDEAGLLPSCFMYLAGLEGTASMLGNPTTITLEGATTEITKTYGEFCGPGTAYNNGNYSGGYTNFGESIGLAIDSDSRMMQLIMETQLPKFDLTWSLAYHNVNTSNNATHRLTTVEQNGVLARLGASHKINNYIVSGDIWYQSYELDTADLQRGPSVQLGIAMTF